jgi:hypothetical protein
MTDVPLDRYLQTIRPDARDTVVALARAVEAADAGFDCKVTYKMLVYTYDARWHQWVVAIGVSRSTVNLRFLYGKELDDPAGILRPGSTTAATADYASPEDVDPEQVAAYVREAAARHPSRA